MFNFWTASRLGQIPFSLRKDVRFYAPLTDSLDFMGIDPVVFTRASQSTAVRRDGLVHSVGPNVPRFQYNGETAFGMAITAGEELTFSTQNGLHDTNTLIWFEDRVPKSTATNANPFASDGMWHGVLNFHISHVLKASRILSSNEIQNIQIALGDVGQAVIPPPEPPPEFDPGLFITEVPSGLRDGANVTFTLSQDVELESILLFYSGLILERVAATPGNMEFVLSGSGNRTITMGLAPQSGFTFFAQYVTAGT